MKTSTVFWSLIVNTILFFMIRYCYNNIEEAGIYNNIEGDDILLSFLLFVLIAHWFVGLIYILETSDVLREYRLNLLLLKWTFFIPSLITVIIFIGFISIKNSIAIGIEKTFNQINKLLDS